MKRTPVTFDYEDFNTSTRRDTDCRKHGIADVCEAPGGGVYIYGAMGCGKTRDDIGDALRAYLGGRALMSYRLFD